MKKYTPGEWLDLGIEETEHAIIIYEDGSFLEGDLFLVPMGSWDADIPQFDFIEKGGTLYGGDFQDLEYIIDLDA